MTISRKQLYEEHQAGDSYSAIAARYGLSVHTIRARVSEYRQLVLDRTPNTPPFLVAVGGRQPAPVSMPSFMDVPVIHSEQIMVTGDWHVPTVDWHFFDLLPKFAEKHIPAGKRHLAIVGDLLNMDAVSKYESAIPSHSLELELAVAERALEYVFEVFDRVWYCLGNHEYRLLKTLHGALSGTRFGRLLMKHIDNQRIIMTVQAQLHLVSGGVDWRLTHPRNYSRNKGIVASQLCQKHLVNVIGQHEHHAAIGRDVYNRFTWVNNGGFFDYEKMAYVMLEDSTSPVMCNAFTYVEDGSPELLTPYESMTNWRRWGIDASLAVAASEARMRRLSKPDTKAPAVSAATKAA